jgi:PAS domain S-box-containing protein
LGIVTDITDIKQLENQLKESEDKYTVLLDSSQDAVFGIKGLSFAYANQRAVEMLGYDSKDDILGRPILGFVAPEQRELVGERTEERLAGLDPLSRYEVKLLRKDGSTILVEFNVSRIEFEGEPMNLTFARDISETVKHRNRLTALLGHAVNLASADSMEEVIEVTLDALADALEFQFASYLVREGDALVIHTRHQGVDGERLPLDGSGLTVKAANTKRSVLVHDTRLEPAYHQGSVHSLSEVDVPIILGDEVVGVLNAEGQSTNMFTDNDVQALKILSIHVSTAIDRLNKQNEMKKLRDHQFNALIEGYKKTSAAVRHDLRAPLMTVINAVSILNQQPDNQQMKEILINKAKFIETVLDDWGDQSYTGEVNRIHVNIRNLFSTVLEAMQVPSGVNVKTSVNGDLEFMLDNNSLIRVVSNLVKNSLEAMNGSGNLTLEGYLGNDGLTLRVIDDGAGIKEELLPQVFTPFFTTKDTGTGIGLSYVKETVEAHGGTAKIESKENKGTTVTLTFPTVVN